MLKYWYFESMRNKLIKLFKFDQFEDDQTLK